MQHLNTLAALHLSSPACVAIGSFDGVHLGHQAVIGGMVQCARASGLAAVTVTFYPHPSVVLHGRRPSFYLSTPEERAERLAAQGVEFVVTLPFNREFANVRAADFVAQLVDQTHMGDLWCGDGFALGYQREGHVPFLRAEGERRGFVVNAVPPVMMDGEAISSTRIRQALRDGAVEQAARYLGRPYNLPGRVTHGARRGRTLGIPTANLAVWEERAVPAAGVYACRAHHLCGTSLAVVNIGSRPTFETGESASTVEAHLLNFSGDLYDTDLALDFVSRLRPEVKFAGVDALRAQIARDIVLARQILVRE